VVAAFVGNGIILILLAILIIWTDYMLRFLVGVIVLVIAYSFLYAAYKIWTIKEEVKKRIP
jgi:hypothetical protein